MDPDNRKSRSRSGRRKPESKRYRPVVAPLKKKFSRQPSAPRSISSSFVMPRSSRGTIQVNIGKKQKPEFIAFLLGMVGCGVLLWSGMDYGPATLGFALFMSGLALILTPPKDGLGLPLNLCVGAIIVAVLFAFVPLFYWKVPDWRVAAVEEWGVVIPSLLTVQPWITFEAVLLLFAGVSWLYAAASWKLNHTGRGYLLFVFSLAVAIYGCRLVFDSEGIVTGGLMDVGEHMTLLSKVDLHLLLLGVAGVVAFGYGAEGIAGRKATHLSGIIGASIVYCILMVNGAVYGLFIFLLGLAMTYLFRLRRGDSTPFYKLSFALLWSNGVTLPVVQDTLSIIAESPVFGIGLGNFPAIFPQYQDNTIVFESLTVVGSDWLRLLAEGGGALLLSICAFVFVFLKMSLRKETGFSAAYRSIALISCLLMLLSMLLSEPFRQPGVAFLLILFLVWAFPRKLDRKPLFRPLVWRIFGSILILFSLVWLSSGWFGASGHSSTKVAALKIDFEDALKADAFAKAEVANRKLLKIKPLSWSAYFDRGVLNLSQFSQLGFDDVDSDFNRAQFCEPSLGEVTLAVGDAWLKHDQRRTVAAWRETLLRSIEGKNVVFAEMLSQAHENYRIMQLMDEVASLSPAYKAQYIDSLAGEALMRAVNKELQLSPNLEQFDQVDRTKIVFRWIVAGDVSSAEEFVTIQEKELDDVWMLWSLIRKSQAQFEEAVALIRDNCLIPEIPPLPEEFDLEQNFAQFERTFLVSSRDPMKGAILLQIYLRKNDYSNALRIIEMLEKEKEVPVYTGYWRAEFLHQLGDNIESWYAFEKYLNLDR